MDTAEEGKLSRHGGTLAHLCMCEVIFETLHIACKRVVKQQYCYQYVKI